MQAYVEGPLCIEGIDYNIHSSENKNLGVLLL